MSQTNPRSRSLLQPAGTKRKRTGIEPRHTYRGSPTLSRTCNDHARLRVALVPPAPGWSRPSSRVAATSQPIGREHDLTTVALPCVVAVLAAAL